MQPNILLIDFETTGVTPGHHDAIQVAALFVSPELEELAAFESLIRPLRPQNASAEAMAIHKKPMSQLMAAPTAHEVMSRLQAGANIGAPPLIAGFNVDFDRRFLTALERDTGIQIERHGSSILCAREIYLKAKGLSRYTKGTRLTDLCALYGIATDGAHDALADVRMTLALLRALCAEHPEAFAFLGGARGGPHGRRGSGGGRGSGRIPGSLGRAGWPEPRGAYL
ncbi:DNA polymerase III subunit epsilon [compost metagenome]